jgi:hypothetical protein
MILPVLLDGGPCKTERQDEKNDPGHLEPQLVCGAPKGAARGSDPAHDRGECTAASSLLPGHPRYYPQLSQSRNLVHGLDFNSPQAYNGATLGNGGDENSEPLRRRWHLTG